VHPKCSYRCLLAESWRPLLRIHFIAPDFGRNLTVPFGELVQPGRDGTCRRVQNRPSCFAVKTKGVGRSLRHWGWSRSERGGFAGCSCYWNPGRLRHPAAFHGFISQFCLSIRTTGRHVSCVGPPDLVPEFSGRRRRTSQRTGSRVTGRPDAMSRVQTPAGKTNEKNRPKFKPKTFPNGLRFASKRSRTDSNSFRSAYKTLQAGTFRGGTTRDLANKRESGRVDSANPQRYRRSEFPRSRLTSFSSENDFGAAKRLNPGTYCLLKRRRALSFSKIADDRRKTAPNSSSQNRRVTSSSELAGRRNLIEHRRSRTFVSNRSRPFRSFTRLTGPAAGGNHSAPIGSLSGPSNSRHLRRRCPRA